MAKGTGMKPYTAEELSLFSSQVALVLHSGMFLPDGLAAMAEESDDPALKSISDSVGREGKLAPALERTGMFPGYMVNMVRIGEESGKLEDVMHSLSTYYEREHAVREQIKSSVLYPVALVGMMLIVIAVLFIKVLPVFSEVFEDLGGATSGISAGMLAAGPVLGYIALGIAAVILALGITLMIKLRSSRGYASLMRAFSRLGPTRKLSEKIAAGRFAFALSMLLESGYSLETALDALPGIVDNDDLNDKIASCRETMAEGESFAAAVSRAGIFSGMYAHIIGVGIRAGALDSVASKIADNYEADTDRSIAAVVSAIEPVLVGILCVVIGAVLLSVMIPLMSIMTSIG